MQDNKCCPYSFYVPVKDKALCDFLESQSNLSMSIRLLLKAFIANYNQDYPDITMMDLRELMESMSVFPDEVLQNAVAEKRSASVIKSEKEPEKIIDMSKELEKPASQVEQDIVIQNDDLTNNDNKSEEPVIETKTVEEPVIETKTVEEPVVETKIVEEPVVETKITEEPVVETKTVEEPVIETKTTEEPVVETKTVEESNETNIEQTDVDESDYEDVVPNIVVEEEKPKKINGSARDAYNNQDAGEEVSADDIMALMGDM